MGISCYLIQLVGIWHKLGEECNRKHILKQNAIEDEKSHHTHHHTHHIIPKSCQCPYSQLASDNSVSMITK